MSHNLSRRNNVKLNNKITLLKSKPRSASDTTNESSKTPKKQKMDDGKPTLKKTPAKRTSMAATYLGRTADGLAASPKKKPQDFSKLHFDKRSLINCEDNLKAKKNIGSALARNSPKKAVQDRYKATVDINKNLLSTRMPSVTDSPTIGKIPTGLVQTMGNNFQQRSSHTTTPTRNGQQKSNLSSVRKNIAQNMDISITGKKDKTDKAEGNCEDFGVMVAVRVRPFNQREIDLKADASVSMNGNETTVRCGSNVHNFVYDHSFWSADKDTGDYASQQTVYEKLARPLLHSSLQGYNTCLFAYGQTGSGKSYTITGLGDDAGIVPRFCDELFSCIEDKKKSNKNISHHIEVSYFEIYKEKIFDLLTSTTSVNTTEESAANKKVLKVREHSQTGPYVEGLAKFSVLSFDDIKSWLEVGNRQRATAATGMNEKSSRSHSVFTITLVETTREDLDGEVHESAKKSQINLVDLAGSERSSTAITTGERFKEGAKINQSLLTLGKVISSLSGRSNTMRKRKQVFVPYRDSTLTWILKESLGGNSRTAMIATISPASCSYEETMSTLRYAKQARSIVNMVKVNEDPNAKLIRELKAEITKLKEASKHSDIDPSKYKTTLKEVSILRQQLCASENEKKEVQNVWKEKLEQSEKRKAEEINELKRAGVSFKVDNRLPNLVNLNEDPQLSELLLYVIKQGTTRVGSKSSDCEIQLNGALIMDLHCKILNRSEIVQLIPTGEAETFVNGELVTSTLTLHHGDRVIIGGDHFFRLNNPIEVKAKGRRNSNNKDFEFAKKELIERQNARIQEEIQEAQIRVKKEMLGEIEAAKRDAEMQILSQKNEYEAVVGNLQAQLKREESTKQELEVIREEKMLLEKEIKVNKRCEEKEAQIVINQKFNSEVIKGLEAESRKLEEQLERMQKRAFNKKAKLSEAAMKLSLNLEEANNLSKTMSKKVSFTRYEDDGDVQIKVSNHKLEIWTLWSVSKFEEKLEKLRESQQGGKEEDLYDPSDQWREIYKEDGEKTKSGSGRRRLTRRLSSIVLARASPILQRSLNELNKESQSPQGRTRPSISVLQLCKNHLTNLMEESEFETNMDKFLLCLQTILDKSKEISTKYQENSDYLDSTLHQRHCLDLTFQVQQTVTLFSAIKCSCQSNATAKLTNQVDRSVKKLTGHLVRQLQGCSEGIEAMINEPDIGSLIPNLSKYCGALAVANHLEVKLFGEEQHHKLCNRMKHAFLQGGDTYLKKTLSANIDKISVLQKNQTLGDGDHFNSKLLKSVNKLFQSCLKLQESYRKEMVRKTLNRNIDPEMHELFEGSLLMRECDISAYYCEYLLRSQNLLKEVECLGEGLTQVKCQAGILKEKNLNLPSSHDNLISAERLLRPTSRIASLCSKNEWLNAMVHDVTSENVSANESALNTTTDRLCSDVAIEASRVLVLIRNFLEKNSGRLDNKSAKSPNSKTRRILPTSPPLLHNDSIKEQAYSKYNPSSSVIIKHAVDKWIKLDNTNE